MSSLKVSNLTVGHGEVIVLRALSFELPPGRRASLIGANGAGKTTLMRTVVGFQRARSGSVEVFGRLASADPRWLRRHVGYVPTEPGLPKHLTAREYLHVFARAHATGGREPNAAVEDIADAVQLGDDLDRPCGVLSRGNAQKVSLARALVSDPDLLLLDEPFTGLDLQAADALERTLLAWPGTLLLATHAVEEANRLTDHVIGLSSGGLIVDAPIAEVVDRHGSLRAGLLATLAGVEGS